MPDPLTIRFRDPDDLREQELRHTVNAFARAIHLSQTYSPPRAPQSVPHAPPRTPATGSELAQRCEELALRHWHWHQEALKADAAGDWDRYIYCAALAQTAREQHDDRARKLAAYAAPLPRVPYGLSGVYDVRPDPYMAQHGAECMRVTPTRMIVDTTQAPPPLQQWLRDYRHGGSEALPWRYCKTRQRYKAQSFVGDAVRAHLRELLDGV